MDAGKDTSNMKNETPSNVIGKSHDELFGRLLVVALFLGALLAVGFFFFLGYRVYEQRLENTFSIADMQESGASEQGTESESEKNEENTKEQVSTEASVADVKQAMLSVLNGGGAKGTAGVLADFLKGSGYAKVTAGNAEGDYSGVTIFYQEGQESAAKAVLADIAKKYPKAVISKADPKRKETVSVPVTVVLGK